MGIIIMGCEGIEAIQWKKLVVDPNYKLAHNHVGFVIAKWLVECNKITPASHCDLYEVLCSLRNFSIRIVRRWTSASNFTKHST